METNWTEQQPPDIDMWKEDLALLVRRAGSLAELSRRIGISYYTLYRWHTGKNRPLVMYRKYLAERANIARA